MCTCIAQFAQSQIPSYVPKDSLVGWWPFNGNANDESGNKNNGIVYGATLSPDRFGDSNRAYFFNGTSDYIKTSVSKIPTKNHSRTFSAWIKYQPTLNYSNWSTILSYGNGNGVSDAGKLNDIFIGTSNHDQIYYNNNEFYNIATYKTKLNEKWAHICITYDSTNLNNISIYINGAKTSAKATNNYGITKLLTTFSDMYFGRTSMSYSGQYFYFKGLIDDIGLWNRALDSTEVFDIYNSKPKAFKCNFIQKDSFTMNFNSKFNHTSIATVIGKEYKIVVNGKWGIANSTIHRDAAYNLTQGGSTVHPTSPIAYNCDACWKLNDTFGLRPSPDTFSSNNFYSYIIKGTGNLLKFTFEDNLYSDNVGSLTFKVYEKSCCSINDLDKLVDISTFKNKDIEFKSTKYSDVQYTWETKVAGLDFIRIKDNSKYSGQSTEKMKINNVNFQNHEQVVKLKMSNNECTDSTIAKINILDSCLFIHHDTMFVQVYDTISVQDTLIINAKLTGTSPLQTNIIKVYPNPAKDYLVINFGNYSSMAGYEINIFDISGKSVYSSTINKANETIDLNTWTGKGVYFIKIIDKSNNQIENRKIVIQ